MTLVVTDDAVPPAQDLDTTAATIGTALIPPVADAGGSYTGTPGAPIQFDSSLSTDSDGDIVSFSWNFGDGGNSNQPNPVHIYATSGNFPVTLTVVDNDSLSDQDNAEASVANGNQPPTADAGGPYGSTTGLAVSFDGSASSDADGTIVSWDWDFGDGNTGTGETTNHTYTVAGPYTVLLTVTDNGGEGNTDDTAANIEQGNQLPVANAGGPYTGSVNVAVTFDGSGSTDADGTILTWDWDFGDGTTLSAGDMPSHTYTAGSNYDVVLTVTDEDGGISVEAFSTASIDSPNQPPVADANGPYVGKVGVPVDFDGSGSTDPDGTIAQYDWVFDDGNTDTGATPSNTYAATGVYDVVLTVTDNGGDTSQSGAQAIIGDGVNLPPTADAGGPYNGDEGVAVNFDGSASSDPDGTIAQYDWAFGDGNTGTGATPSNTYATADNYLVTLTVTDDGVATDTAITVASIGMGNQIPTADAGGPYAGAVNQPMRLNGTGSDDADGYLVSASWDFGDGSPTGSGLIPTHTYTGAGPYTAKLTVTDNDGGTDQSSATVVIGDGASLPPTADANGPYAGVTGTPVPFDGTNSSDPDGTIAAWDWAFGDGMTGTGETPSNTYLAGSIYNVILQVTDDDSLIATDSTTASIGIFSLPPVADASGPSNATVGVPVSFNGGGSSDPDGTIAQYAWDFGDGDTGTGPTPDHPYAASGRYLVKLTVTDDTGETDTDITVATIGVGNLPPVADADPVSSAVVGVPVPFSGRGSDMDGVIVEFKWEYGDGGKSGPRVPAASKVTAASVYQPAATSEDNLVHTYDAPGTYFVTMTVTDDDGAVGSDSIVVNVAAASGGGGSSGDNIFGCSIGTNEVKDPTLPLLALLAVIYVIRRRLGGV